ncbi:MAG: hypothetical protein KDC87_20455 [Planctomycetes bacterium]|nr:hypothetical protein [Planctomycetota bacterium]MCB9868381.1 hypothetical protein [Planctomycetota bacterium]MCB9889626.1 hypothetical protein [Planctomycetota bacterium]
MAKRALCYLLFFVIETLIIVGSLVLVVCVYLPFVAIKGVLMTLLGKATPRVGSGTASELTS